MATGRARWLIVALPALVLLVDLLITQLQPGTAVLAALDETAHLSTAALVLSVGWSVLRARDLAARVPRPFWVVALLSAVAIDVDHVPGTVFGSDAFSQDVARPYSHSLLTPLLLGLLALALRVRPGVRGPAGTGVALAGGAAVGVCLHFSRDLFTGPGLPLAWPLSDATAALPYVVYLLFLLAVTAVGLVTVRDGGGPGRRVLRRSGRTSA